ncbi:MAG: hypothetical protein AAFP19_18680 [Bacteroidota bacterium]
MRLFVLRRAVGMLFAIQFLLLAHAQTVDRLSIYAIDFAQKQPLDTFLIQQMDRFSDGREQTLTDFNANGEVLTKAYWHWKDTLLIAKTIWQFKGRDSLKLVEQEYRDGRLIHEVKYDEEGHAAFLKSLFYRDSGQTYRMTFRRLPEEEVIYGLDYQYDAAQRLVQIVLLGRDLKAAHPDNFDFNGPFRQEADTVLFSYSRKGLQQKSSHYHYPRKKNDVLVNRRTKYFYTLFKNRVKCSKTWSNGRLVEIQQYRYRRNGQLLETWRTDTHDTELERQMYDEQGQISRELIFQNGYLKRLLCHRCQTTDLPQK